jgi:hypothetical protein
MASKGCRRQYGTYDLNIILILRGVRSVRGSLKFGRIQYAICYRPESRNVLKSIITRNKGYLPSPLTLQQKETKKITIARIKSKSQGIMPVPVALLGFDPRSSGL